MLSYTSDMVKFAADFFPENSDFHDSGNFLPAFPSTGFLITLSYAVFF